MRHVLFASVSTLAVIASSHAFADVRQPDDHAPIGVSGDHLHKQGEWMVSYKFKRTTAEGMRVGTDSVSNASVMAAYGEAPVKMGMDMHMFEVMYGVTDKLTLMLMPQWMQMDMTHASSHGGGHAHTHEITGWGDTELTALYSLYDSPEHKLHLNAGVNVPTGASDETFLDHHNNPYPLPYNMQFGSGTYDPIIGATYMGQADNWSWGAQTINYIRVGKNDDGWRQGNKYTATGWAARNLTNFASLSLRVEGEAWDDVNGRNRRLPYTTIAGAQPYKQAGERALMHVGLNLVAPESMGILAGHRIATEFGMPVYERYAGPQTETDYRLTVGWQKSF